MRTPDKTRVPCCISPYVTAKLSKYSVAGPFAIPQQKVGGGRTIATDKLDAFWDKCGGSDTEHGCYVFCMTKGKGVVPWYVGKTAKRSFRGECFTPDKLVKFNTVLLKKPKSRPVLFFIRRPTHKGKRNQKQIGRLETWLIAQTKAVNLHLVNKQNIPRESWGITGIIRGGPGKRSDAAESFRRAVDI